jgi:hypothetical protein
MLDREQVTAASAVGKKWESQPEIPVGAEIANRITKPK